MGFGRSQGAVSEPLGRDTPGKLRLSHPRTPEARTDPAEDILREKADQDIPKELGKTGFHSIKFNKYYDSQTIGYQRD